MLNSVVQLRNLRIRRNVEDVFDARKLIRGFGKKKNS
jgi:hypothetical protein